MPARPRLWIWLTLSCALAACAGLERPGVNDGVRELRHEPTLDLHRLTARPLAVGGAVLRRDSMLDRVLGHDEPRLAAWADTLQRAFESHVPGLDVMSWETVRRSGSAARLDRLLAAVELEGSLRPPDVRVWARDLDLAGHVAVLRVEDAWSYGTTYRTMIVSLAVHDLASGRPVWACTMQRTLEWDLPEDPPEDRGGDRERLRTYGVRAMSADGFLPLRRDPEPEVEAEIVVRGPAYPPSIDLSLAFTVDRLLERLVGDLRGDRRAGEPARRNDG